MVVTNNTWFGAEYLQKGYLRHVPSCTVSGLRVSETRKAKPGAAKPPTSDVWLDLGGGPTFQTKRAAMQGPAPAGCRE